jgi:hypothetical protein
MIATGALPTGLTGKVPKPLLRDNTAFRNFAIVWALASLFHMAHSGIFDTRLNLALLTIAALYVVFKPSLSGFLAVILLQLLDVALRMPDVTNHWLFTAFVNITFLQTILYCVYKRRSFDIDEVDVYETFAPAARVEVLILYFWAVFHKLNAGFFAPEVSCATELMRAQHLDGLLSAFPQLLSVNAYFTILVEFGILLMLSFRRTRNAGILIGFLFHLVLSFSTYNAFFDFTSMIIAGYFLFTTYEFNRKVDQWRTNTVASMKSFFNSYSITKLGIIGLSAVILLGILAVLNKILHDFKLFHLYFFWTLYGLILLYVLIRFLKLRNQTRDTANSFALKTRWLLIVPVIVFLNGASPYLGLKTENSYAMFSNLRTEGGITNHFIVPASVQIFDFQKSMVEIVSSSDARLQKLADDQQLMVLFEFRNYLQKYKPDEVAYRLNGKASVFRNGETRMTGSLKPNSVLLSRLMEFRTISKNEPQPCAH